ncbi:MAG: hypothetical protein CVU61_10130 [Deltaproteobacteria bacterium HGW-Deltaproteobacteria-19]|nr:MAG: hypothetical protein CVU61_10130 [Deltaproteobacteria bacterium HGW-Deltaproteobacteria-19]
MNDYACSYFKTAHYDYSMYHSIMIALVLSILFMPSIGLADTVRDKFDIKGFTKVVDGKYIISLPAGLYQISETIVLPSNTIFEGTGPSTILKVASPFFGQRFITNSNERDGCENITLRSFKMVFDLPILTGNLPGIMRFENVRNLQLNNITMILDTKYYGIDLSANIQSAIIENNIIENWGQGGTIMVRNRHRQTNKESNNIIIRNNTLLSAYDEPLAVFGWMGSVRNITLEGNNVKGEGASFGITAFAIDTLGHTGKLSDVVISKNIITGGKHGAIGIKGGATNISVSENKIHHAAGDGIFIHTGGNGLPRVSDVLVIDNEISDTGRHGILATGSEIRIEKNKISNTNASGVYMHGTVTVMDNQVKDAKPGILADGDQMKLIKRNRFRNAPIRILNKKGTEIKGNITE